MSGDDALLFQESPVGGPAPFLCSQVEERLLELFADLGGYVFIVEV